MSRVKATYSGFVSHDGIPVLLSAGDEFDSEDPLVQARPDLFTEPPRRPVLRGKGKGPAEESKDVRPAAGTPPGQAARTVTEPSSGKPKARGDG